jgi:hypothetical protein
MAAAAVRAGEGGRLPDTRRVEDAPPGRPAALGVGRASWRAGLSRGRLDGVAAAMALGRGGGAVGNCRGARLEGREAGLDLMQPGVQAPLHPRQLLLERRQVPPELPRPGGAAPRRRARGAAGRGGGGAGGGAGRGVVRLGGLLDDDVKVAVDPVPAVLGPRDAAPPPPPPPPPSPPPRTRRPQRREWPRRAGAGRRAGGCGRVKGKGWSPVLTESGVSVRRTGGGQGALAGRCGAGRQRCELRRRTGGAAPGGDAGAVVLAEVGGQHLLVLEDQRREGKHPPAPTFRGR